MPNTQVKLNDPNKDFVGATWRYLPVIAKNFKFSEQEMRTLMGDMPRATYQKGLKTEGVKLSKDQFGRFSLMLGIQKALVILLGSKDQAFSWIDRANTLPPFFGSTPREFIMQGDYFHLYETRKMLDAWRG